MLIRHSMIYVFAKIVPGMMGMMTTALLTRLLDPGSFGLYGLALIIMTFGSTMVFDWLCVSLLRFYEGQRDNPLIFSTFIQIFLCLLAGSALLTALAWLCGLFDRQHATIIGAGILMMWAYSWFELVGQFKIANFHPGQYLTMNCGRGMFIISGAGAAAWATHSPVWTAIGTAVGTAMGAALGGFRRCSLGAEHFDRELAGKVLAFGLPLAASMTLGGLVNSGTRTLLEVLDSSQALGLYTAAFVLVQSTISLTAGGISSVTYQLAVRAVESGDPETAHQQLVANSTLLLAVLAPAALGMALNAHGIATTLVGPKFIEGVTVLTPWMAASAFIASLRAHYLDHAFQLGMRPSLQIVVTTVAAAVGLGLSVFLIPRLGPVGAAMAATIAMMVSCGHAWIAGRGVFPLPLPVAGGARVLLACLVMAVVIICIPDSGTVTFVVRVAAGALSYGAATVALNVLGLRNSACQAVRATTVAWRGHHPARQGR